MSSSDGCVVHEQRTRCAEDWTVAQEQAEELIQRARKQCLDEGVDPDTVVLDSDASRDGEFLSLPELAVQLCTNVSGQMPCSAGGYCEWNQVVQTYAQRYKGRAYPVAAKGSAFVPGRYLRSREAYEAYVGGRREGGAGGARAGAGGLPGAAASGVQAERGVPVGWEGPAPG